MSLTKTNVVILLGTMSYHNRSIIYNYTTVKNFGDGKKSLVLNKATYLIKKTNKHEIQDNIKNNKYNKNKK